MLSTICENLKSVFKLGWAQFRLFECIAWCRRPRPSPRNLDQLKEVQYHLEKD